MTIDAIKKFFKKLKSHRKCTYRIEVGRLLSTGISARKKNRG